MLFCVRLDCISKRSCSGRPVRTLTAVVFGDTEVKETSSHLWKR
ncbi:hypothetical protein BU14_0397s0013 [Porphyra umbilicalis]|uniref:Uncharacterized protein n=1 Tax=Porphyra umbilicalis TaxID=2786 RepID=A0A1X6NW91_PORUM|nr:hypothetical protein BU14_0397s0013 [Porphyra umbilicalis]|eukprot:OSX72889.1 hypothetical protein BU14_0397s0013 [Porphyra umbilicalis]